MEITASTSDFDVIFLSYDEPNADENWADLVNKIPWAKRIHGIKGFDTAHKECARASNSDNFITIDGDNKVNETFFDQEIILNPGMVYSWRGKNYINHLMYGNGGLKLWPKALVLNMETHESSKDGNGIEFCWHLPYKQMYNCYSISYNNFSPYQAFRVGFREGVKLCLDNGTKTDLNNVWHGNIKRLMIWMTVGADVENGIYAIYGARVGCYLTNLTEFDISKIADYDWFNDAWQNQYMPIVEDQEHFAHEYKRLAEEIRENLQLPITNLGAGQSRFFKATLENPLPYNIMQSEQGIEKTREKHN